MQCPDCDAPRLRCEAHVTTVHPDGRRTFTSQWWKCGRCDESYYGVLTQWTADGWVELVGYEVPGRRYRRTVQTARGCPDPDDVGCACAAHAQYGTPWFGGTHRERWRQSQRAWDHPAEAEHG